VIDVGHDDPVWRASILFLQTGQVVLKAADSYLYKKAGSSVIQFITLQGLVSNKGVMTPSELAEWTFTERHNITALVNRMKRKRLATSERSTKDKRIVNVAITVKGREALAQAMPVAREFVDKVMSSITESDATLISKHLRVLRGNAIDTLRQLTRLVKKWPE